MEDNLAQQRLLSLAEAVQTVQKYSLLNLLLQFGPARQQRKLRAYLGCWTYHLGA